MDSDLRDIIINDQKIVLKAGHHKVTLYDVEFKNCEVIFNDVSKNIIVGGVIFNQSKLIFKKKFINKQWTRSRILNCTITGNLIGNDFGGFPDDFYPTTENYHAVFENNDLSNCILDGIRFFKVDFNTIKLPKWPNFILLNPIKNGNKITEFYARFNKNKTYSRLQYPESITGIGLYFWDKYNKDLHPFETEFLEAIQKEKDLFIVNI